MPVIDYTPKPVAPSSRTITKGSRDALIALIGFCVTYTGVHYADLGLNPEFAAIVPVAANFAYRWLRGATGGEPE